MSTLCVSYTQTLVVLVSHTSRGLEGSQQFERQVFLVTLSLPIVLGDLDFILANL